MSKIFNRKSAEVIEFAKNNSLEDFVKQYSATSASEDTLTKAYNEIAGDGKTGSAKSKVSTVKSKKAEKPVEDPSARKVYALDEDGEVKPVDTTNIPKRTDLKDAEITEDGRAIKKPATSKEKAAKEKTPASKKADSAPKKEAKPKTEGLGPKRDAIRALLAENPEITNKEIKTAILAQGYPSIYDSEIASCRK